jgi:hypothetical protein
VTDVERLCALLDAFELPYLDQQVLFSTGTPVRRIMLDDGWDEHPRMVLLGADVWWDFDPGTGAFMKMHVD